MSPVETLPAEEPTGVHTQPSEQRQLQSGAFKYTSIHFSFYHLFFYSLYIHLKKIFFIIFFLILLGFFYCCLDFLFFFFLEY